MSFFSCDLSHVLLWVVNFYTLLLFVYAVLSWIPDLRRGRWSYYLGRLIEPVLNPIRRVIPPVGGIDIAFLVLILVLQMPVRWVLFQLVQNSCDPFN